MKIVKKGMVVCKHGVLKARCVEWFGRVVRGLNFGSTKTAGVLKGGFKVDKLFNQFREGCRGNFHRSRGSFVSGGVCHGSVRSVRGSIFFVCRNDGDGWVEKIIIERFCLLGEKSIEGVDGGQ